jgi:hypothetical protein
MGAINGTRRSGQSMARPVERARHEFFRYRPFDPAASLLSLFKLQCRESTIGAQTGCTVSPQLPIYNIRGFADFVNAPTPTGAGDLNATTYGDLISNSFQKFIFYIFKPVKRKEIQRINRILRRGPNRIYSTVRRASSDPAASARPTVSFCGRLPFHGAARATNDQMRCLDVLRFEVGVIGEHFVPGAPWANGPTITETGMRQPRIQGRPPRILQSKAMRSSLVSLLLKAPRHYHKKPHCEACSPRLWAGSSTLQCVPFGPEDRSDRAGRFRSFPRRDLDCRIRRC